MSVKIYSFFLNIVKFLPVYCLCSYGGTTGILEGRVVDASSKAQLINVTVQVGGTKNGAVTDEEGYYQINNIIPGKYLIQFSIIGYSTGIVREVIISADHRTRLDVELNVSTVNLQTVEITAKQSIVQKDQMMSIFAISDKKLMALPVTNVQDVLALQPGTTLDGNVRGGKTTEVMYLIDGLSVQDVMDGGFGMQVPRTSISNMVIYTGGYEAEYGNALSGIVNIITKTGDNEFKESISVNSDNLLGSSLNQQTDRRYELEIFAKGPLISNKLFYFTSNNATFSDSRWWSDFHYFFPSPIRQDFSGLNKIEYVASSDLRIALQSIYTISRWSDYEFSWRFNLTGLPKREIDSYRFALIFSGILSENSAYTFSVSRSYKRSHVGPDTKQDLLSNPYQYDFYLRYVIAGAKEWWAENRQQIYTAKGDYTSQLNKFNFFKMGFEVNQFTISSDIVKFEPQLTYFGKPINGATLLNYSNDYNYFPRTGSVYVQDRIESSHDGAIVNFGVRWDFLDPQAELPIINYTTTDSINYQQHVLERKKVNLKQQVSPRLGFAAPIDSAKMIFFNIGYYFQLPFFDYLYSGTNPVQLRSGSRNVLAGNPNLEPEKTVAWEVGYKQEISDALSVSVTYFQKNTTNQIDSKTFLPFDSKYAGDFGFASYVNNAEAKVSGLEFVVSRESDGFVSGNISYTYMNTEGLSETVDQSINFAQWGFPIRPTPFPLSWDQRHSVKVDGSIKLPYDIQSNFIVLYNSPRPYTYFPTQNGFTPLNPSKDFVPNNARMAEVIFVNLKLSREFMLGDVDNYKLDIYADIRNLLNTKNVKWIDSNGRIGGELGDPSAYYDPRRVRLGCTLGF